MILWDITVFRSQGILYKLRKIGYNTFKMNVRKHQEKESTSDRNFTERFPAACRTLRGNGGEQMENGFGVAGLSRNGQILTGPPVIAENEAAAAVSCMKCEKKCTINDRQR